MTPGEGIPERIDDESTDPQAAPTPQRRRTRDDALAGLPGFLLALVLSLSIAALAHGLAMARAVGR